MWRLTLRGGWMKAQDSIEFRFTHKKEATTAMATLLDLLEYTNESVVIEIRKAPAATQEPKSAEVEKAPFTFDDNTEG